MRIQRINRSLAWGITILMLFLTLGNGAVVWADETTGNSTIEKHLAKGYVTQQDLKKTSQNVETENGAISASHFQFVCVNHNAGASACTDLQTGSIDSIKGGKLRNNVPLILKNSAGVDHSFSRAHIGNTAVYFVGMLTIRDDDRTTQDYVYYTTDENITNKTVYPVLKANEKITLEYTHGKDHVVTYQFKDADGNITSEDPDGWSLDQVFGEERPLEVANGKSYNDTVTMVTMDSKETVTETTTLSTGTKITLSVKSNNGKNGITAIRSYHYGRYLSGQGGEGGSESAKSADGSEHTVSADAARNFRIRQQPAGQFSCGCFFGSDWQQPAGRRCGDYRRQLLAGSLDRHRSSCTRRNRCDACQHAQTQNRQKIKQNHIDMKIESRNNNGIRSFLWCGISEAGAGLVG